MRALSRVAREVARRAEEVAAKLHVREGLLGEYRKLGREFEGVVEEYRSLKAVLEEKMWSRDQLLGAGERNETY